ncbi:MAG: hypothetical protein QMD71_07240 [bacterium]|nr:hypothetical protein [bacterium]
MKKNKRAKLTPWLYSSKSEHIPGFCSVCSELVDVTVRESLAELLGICSKCGSALFYLDKLHTPPEAEGLVDFENLMSWSSGD